MFQFFRFFFLGIIIYPVVVVGVISVILNLVVGVHISGLVDLGNHRFVLAK